MAAAAGAATGFDWSKLFDPSVIAMLGQAGATLSPQGSPAQMLGNTAANWQQPALLARAIQQQTAQLNSLLNPQMQPQMQPSQVVGLGDPPMPQQQQPGLGSLGGSTPPANPTAASRGAGSGAPSLAGLNLDLIDPLYRIALTQATLPLEAQQARAQAGLVEAQTKDLQSRAAQEDLGFMREIYKMALDSLSRERLATQDIEARERLADKQAKVQEHLLRLEAQLRPPTRDSDPYNFLQTPQGVARVDRQTGKVDIALPNALTTEQRLSARKQALDEAKVGLPTQYPSPDELEAFRQRYVNAIKQRVDAGLLLPEDLAEARTTDPSAILPAAGRVGMARPTDVNDELSALAGAAGVTLPSR